MIEMNLSLRVSVFTIVFLFFTQISFIYGQTGNSEISDIYPNDQLSINRDISIQLGIIAGSHFVDRSYDYNYGNSNTVAGIGGFSFGVIYKDRFKLKFSGTNLDASVIGAGIEPIFISKQFSYSVAFAKCLVKKRHRLDYGISYLYFYERNTSRGPSGIQFSSNDHYIGGYFRFKYLISKGFGPFLDYYYTPLRINNDGGFGYNHNISIGISTKIY